MNGWPTIRLGDYADVSYGYTAKASFEDIGPKFLRITDIQDDNVDWDTVPTCSIEKKKYKKQQLRHGDIVFARTGATTGKSFLIDNPPESVAASYLIRLRLNNAELLPDYVSVFFKTYEYWEMVNQGISGSAQGGFNASKLADLALPLPPLPEQQRIVAILDDAFERIDAAIANTEKNLANARELFESYLNEVFARKGEGWEEKKLADVCENLDKKRIPITKSKREPGSIPYYGASGIVDYVKGYIFDEDLLLVSEDGANLLARTYPIAFSISGKTWVNNHAHVLRFRDMRSQRFIEYYLNSISLAPYVCGMAQPKLNQKQLNSIPVPFPSVEDQRNIVSSLDSLCSQTQQLQYIWKQKLAALAELKQSILQKAFAGELTADMNREALAI
jgi:type I restriction enzyme S subunit